MMAGLPSRDLWLIPLISLLTALAMLAGAEALARVVWPEQKFNACSGPSTTLPFRYRASCTSTMKTAEGPWYTNVYNECGYRSDASCGATPLGTRRIALIGSSLSEGYLVEYPNTIGARLASDLTTMCGRPVEVQNLAASGYTGRRVVTRMEEALTLHPSAVVYTQNAFDIELQLDDASEPITGVAPSATAMPAPEKPAPSSSKSAQRLRLLLQSSRAVLVAQHFLFSNPDIYLPIYLTYGDKADFLRTPFTPAWQERLRRFELLLRALKSRADQAQVPLVLAYVPHRAQLEIIKSQFQQPGLDPYQLNNALAAIAARNGVAFIDTTRSLTATHSHELLYYVVDGHPSGHGQPIIAQAIAGNLRELGDGRFADCQREADGIEVAKTR